jgi:hypothetical protein
VATHSHLPFAICHPGIGEPHPNVERLPAAFAPLTVSLNANRGAGVQEAAFESIAAPRLLLVMDVAVFERPRAPQSRVTRCQNNDDRRLTIS